MKKMLQLIVIFTFILSSVSLVTTATSTKAAISNKPGDIIITRSTSSKGVTGHIGIYIDATTILHTSGWSSEPYPKTISESGWHSRYAESKVIRPNSSTLGQSAASKAIYYFKGKSIPYSVTTGPTNISQTYCSELVWYSYYKAGKTFKVFNSASQISTWVTPSIIKPYDYLSSSHLNYNGFSFIDNTW
jgi:uncharacterized protein YycO